MTTTRIAGTARNASEARAIRKTAQIHAYATHIRSIATDHGSPRGDMCGARTDHHLHDHQHSDGVSSSVVMSRLGKATVPRWSPYVPYVTA